MKAQTLAKSIDVLDPDRALTTLQELDAFFVERADSPIFEIADLLKNAVSSPAKILFTGQRGSGKSTEISKLCTILPEFFIVPFSIKDRVNLFDISYVDVMLATATELIRKATEDHVTLDKSLLEDIYHWFRAERIFEETVEGSAKGNISASLNMLVVKLQTKFGTEASTRTTIRTRIEPRLSELIERINLIIAALETELKKRVLIIVEDLDKTDLAKAAELFVGHAMTLTSPNCMVIYTYPIALRHDTNFRNMCQNFDEHFVLPNFKIFHKDGRDNLDGIGHLKKLVYNRLEEKLIAPDALDSVIRLCGGLPRELIRLCRRAALLAIGKKKSVIDKEC
ncbi:MAG: hypothetical protein ONA69_09140, partial [candidate division KSB1 bacterium]|nr:hypothetical protein [candidate division KSB1 bacterium]